MNFGNTTVEWSDAVEVLIDRLEGEAEERDLTREERALMDVVETSQLLVEGDGLHDFWQSGLDKGRITNSFDLVGASAMVDVLNASQWCAAKDEDRGDYSGRESAYLAEIEEDLDAALAQLNDEVSEFVEDELGE